jgi:hypothetical protein
MKSISISPQERIIEIVAPGDLPSQLCRRGAPGLDCDAAEMANKARGAPSKRLRRVRRFKVFVTVARSALHGHGCFATRAVAAREVVAIARLLIFPPEETELISRTRLKHYIFYVRDGVDEGPPYVTAVAMGPVSFCNHSFDPNCSFSIDEQAAEVTLIARRPIDRNEEITIDYGDYAEEVVNGASVMTAMPTTPAPPAHAP